MLLLTTLVRRTQIYARPARNVTVKARREYFYSTVIQEQVYRHIGDSHLTEIIRTPRHASRRLIKFIPFGDKTRNWEDELFFFFFFFQIWKRLQEYSNQKPFLIDCVDAWLVRRKIWCIFSLFFIFFKIVDRFIF